MRLSTHSQRDSLITKISQKFQLTERGQSERMRNMLDKQDLRAIEKLLKRSIKDSENRLTKFMQKTTKDAFADFYESIFLPHAERNDKDHLEIKQEMRSMKKELSEYIKDHEKRIVKLERVTNVN